jgi:hypothetical protein
MSVLPADAREAMEAADAAFEFATEPFEGGWQAAYAYHQKLLARLRHERDEYKRAGAIQCVLCHHRYGKLEDRKALHQFPDGCTAHEQCYLDDPPGIEGYARYHAEAAREEDHEREQRLREEER